MAYISYESNKGEYQRLWDSMKIIRDAKELHRISQKLTAHRQVYIEVEKATGVPWQMVAVIHLREAGETDIGVWKRVLHNGERIVGTGRKTRIVPIGRGPFKTWHEAACHALREKAFDKIKAWPVSRMLWALEPYNGYGYRNRGLRSPYLWASTNHQQRGKYVADHVFDSNVMDSQVGCAALLKFLGAGAPMPVPRPAAAVMSAGVIGIAGVAASISVPDYLPYIVAGTIAIALLIGIIVFLTQKE